MSSGHVQDAPSAVQVATIAIIGMGFAGTWQEIALIDASNRDLCIYEIEAHEHRRHGGIAFGECNDRHQVNLPPERQFGLAEDWHDYLNWLNSTDRSVWPEPYRSSVGSRYFTPGSGEYPRMLFRLYSTERLRQAKERAALAGRNMVYIPIDDEAVAVDESGARAVITLASGATIDADAWVAATGHGAPTIPGFMQDVAESERVVMNPWSKEAMGRMAARDQSESIFYVGTGMTTYDLIILSEVQGHRGECVMMSRNGELHHVYEEGFVFEAATLDAPEALAHATTADELLHGIPGTCIGAIEEYQQLTAPLHEGGSALLSEQVLSAWEKYIPVLVERLPHAELVNLFKRKTVLNTRRIGIAPEVGNALQRARARGLATWKGSIYGMREADDGIYIDLTHEDDPQGRHEERFDRVYCGLGMSNDFGWISEQNPFWENVIQANQMTTPHPFGGVYAEPGGKLPGARAGYATGMPLSGTRLQKGWAPTISGVVVSIRDDLTQIADRILADLEATG